MTAGLKLPEGLQFHRAAIEEALGIAVPWAWPEGERILAAEQPEAIGRALVHALHHHLREARIAYVFVEEKRERDRVTLGHAAKASTKVRFLAAVD